MKTNYIIEHEIQPFAFNESYDRVVDRELLETESIFVFAFENYFGYTKYIWDEINNLIIDIIEKDSNRTVIIIYGN